MLDGSSTRRIGSDGYASRRQFVSALVMGTTAGIAGCSALSSDSPMLDVELFNHTDHPYTVEMALYRSTGDQTRSKARSYDSSLEVPPQGETGETGIAKVQPYVVRWEAYGKKNRLTHQDHVHYYPDDGGDNDALSFDILPRGVLTRRRL